MSAHFYAATVPLHQHFAPGSHKDRRAFVSATTRLVSAFESMTPVRAKSMMRAAMIFSVLFVTVDLEDPAGFL
jgi:hypothetical protein